MPGRKTDWCDASRVAEGGWIQRNLWGETSLIRLLSSHQSEDSMDPEYTTSVDHRSQGVVGVVFGSACRSCVPKNRGEECMRPRTGEELFLGSAAKDSCTMSLGEV